jgi:molybdopterin converting factor small subunit
MQRGGCDVVTVFIPTAFRKFSDEREQVQVAGGSSLRQVIERLEGECPGIKEQLLLNGGIHPGLAIFVNDEQISQGLIEQIPDDATVRILPAMGGGSY